MQKNLLISLGFFVFLLGAILPAQADYTCAESIDLVNQKINAIKKEIANRQANPNASAIGIQKLISINKLIQATYKIILKSRVGADFTKYSPAEWDAHDPAELIKNISNEEETLATLKEQTKDLENLKETLIDYDTADGLCDFELGANDWVFDISFSLREKYPEIIYKFELFANRNLEVLDILPSSPGLIREEFEDEIFDKTELRAIVKQEIKNRKQILRKVIRIYRLTNKIS